MLPVRLSRNARAYIEREAHYPSFAKDGDVEEQDSRPASGVSDRDLA